MVQHTNTPPLNQKAFLKNGAVMQTAPDQFKLIMGPFSEVNFEASNRQDEVSFVYQPHFWDFLDSTTESKSLFKGVSGVTFKRNELLNWLREVKSERPKLAWQNVDSQPFKEQFEWSQRAFSQNQLAKTVPLISQKSRTRFTAENLVWVITHHLSENHFGWAYGFWQNGEGFFGQTPELLVDWKNDDNKLKTSALAGTVKNEPGQEAVILSDQKIRQEHQFVVDDIAERLQTLFSNGQIQKNETQVLKLKHLLHLKTDFFCNDVTRAQALRVIQSLHPTAALGIYPRNVAEMTAFSELNLQNDRLSFAAPFAFVEKNEILAVAAIRNFYFSATEVKILSGCGITTESVYETELAELELKRESVKRMMGLNE